jgi:hypothetical protein
VGLSAVVDDDGSLVDRSRLAAVARADDRAGLLVCSADGELAVPLGRDGYRHAEEITAEVLDAAGVTASDSVVVALNNDGAGVGVRWALAASSIARSACAWGPRQLRRLLRLLHEVGADVLVTTPTLARRLLREARLADDQLAGQLRSLILVGPVSDPHVTELRVGFGAIVREAWCDPIFGIGMAVRDPIAGGPFELVRPGLVDLVRLDAGGSPAAVVEWVLSLGWAPWDGLGLRTGLVGPATGDGALHPPAWTVGDQILVRGRWLSLAVVEAALATIPIQPLAAASLQVRRDLVGDRVELLVDGFDPAALAELRRILDASSPVHIELVASQAAAGAPRFVDHRRQHVGS